MNWLSPTKVIELWSFFGLTNYYRWFIKSHLKKVNLLKDLLKKNQK